MASGETDNSGVHKNIRTQKMRRVAIWLWALSGVLVAALLILIVVSFLPHPVGVFVVVAIAPAIAGWLVWYRSDAGFDFKNQDN